MTAHRVVTREQWTAERREFLAKEKELTRLRDDVSRQRRDLPWVAIDKTYVFDGPAGEQSLGEIFEGRRQLIVYHFMYGPEWTVGCKSCSFWADTFNGIVQHLNQRDVTFVAVSRAPLVTLQAFEARMGWTFTWLSSLRNDFNFDFHVSFRAEEVARKDVDYNYDRRETSMSEFPGVSVFFRERDDTIFHTYSCYARGLDILNGAYQYLDLAPKGRDEAELAYPMAWVKHHDLYER